MLLIVAFSCNSPIFWLFLQMKFTFRCLGLNYIVCWFLWTNCILSCFTLKGQSPDRQQPIKEPSQKYYPIVYKNQHTMWLSLFSVSSLTDTTEFQFAFNGKIIGTWSDMFEGTNCRLIIMIFSLLEEQL